MVNDESADPSVTTLLDMMAGHRITAVIYTAAKLEIPELLDGGPKTAGEVAAKTGAHEASISRLLRALVIVHAPEQSDVFVAQADGEEQGSQVLLCGNRFSKNNGLATATAISPQIKNHLDRFLERASLGIVR